MRIIKEGKLPPKEKKMTCPECGCVFMYYKSGNYFKTEEAAEKVAEQIREIFKNSKAE